MEPNNDIETNQTNPERILESLNLDSTSLEEMISTETNRVQLGLLDEKQRRKLRRKISNQIQKLYLERFKKRLNEEIEKAIDEKVEQNVKRIIQQEMRVLNQNESDNLVTRFQGAMELNGNFRNF